MRPHMTTTLRPLQFVTLICAALVFGLTLTHVLQGPGSRALSGPQWLVVQNTFYGGFAVVGGIAEVVGLISAAILAVRAIRQRDVRAAVAPLTAALCLLGTLVVYWFGNRPVNNRVANWTPDTLPPDWTAYRDTWETAHATSAGLAGIALLVIAIALVWGRVSPSRLHRDDANASCLRL